MKLILKALFLGTTWFAAAAVCAAPAPPTPLLWKAQTDAGIVYLLGSFHLLKADDYPVHPEVDAAYAQADKLVFELDPAELASPDTVKAITALARFDDGRRLREVISAETAEKLQAFMGGSEAAMIAADPFKPWFMGMNLMLGTMTTIGLDPKLGLDQHFMQRAAMDGKPVSGLETALDQMRALDRSPLDEQEHMLSEALEPAAEMRERIFELHDVWRRGDPVGLETLVNQDMATQTPQMYALLNHDRNQEWLPQLLAMLGETQTHLVVVGAMHLIGDDGLVEQLKRRGVDVRRIDVKSAETMEEAA